MIQWTKSKPQETLDFKINKQKETSSFSPPINLVEENKWFLAVTTFEATYSVFNVTSENISFSISIPGHWETKLAQKTINERNKLLEFRSQNGIELHVKEVGKGENQIKM